MFHYLIMCRSLTYAQRAINILERSGISAHLTQVPQNISSQGCGYAIKVSEKRFHSALQILDSSGFERRKIFMGSSSSDYREVFL